MIYFGKTKVKAWIRLELNMTVSHRGKTRYFVQKFNSEQDINEQLTFCLKVSKQLTFRSKSKQTADLFLKNINDGLPQCVLSLSSDIR